MTPALLALADAVIAADEAGDGIAQSAAIDAYDEACSPDRIRALCESWLTRDAAPREPVKAEPVDRNRATTEPGGCECEKCGCIFIGAEWMTLCGVCYAAQEDGP